jgi:hypothetical protein
VPNQIISETIKKALELYPHVKTANSLRGVNPLEHGRARIEITYTHLFAENVFGFSAYLDRPGYTVMETFKHGTQMIGDRNIFQDLLLNGIENKKMNMVGLLPPRSLNLKHMEMDDGIPFYLGNKDIIQQQLETISLLAKDDFRVLVNLLIHFPPVDNDPLVSSLNFIKRKKLEKKIRKLRGRGKDVSYLESELESIPHDEMRFEECLERLEESMFELVR